MKVFCNDCICFDDDLKEVFEDPKNFEITVPGDENCTPYGLICSKSFVLTCEGESHTFVVKCSEKVFDNIDECFIRNVYTCNDDDVSEGFPNKIVVRCKLFPWRAADRYVSNLDEDEFLDFCEDHKIGIFEDKDEWLSVHHDEDEGDLCKDELLEVCKEAWGDIDDDTKSDIIWSHFQYDISCFDCDDDYSDELEIVEMTAEE